MTIIEQLQTLCPTQSFREASHPEQLFRASMLGYCPRKQLLAASDVRLQDAGWWRRKMSLHTGAHDNLQQWIVDHFKHTNLVLTEEIVYDPVTHCGGHIDAIVVDGDTAYVCELKTYVNLPKDLDNSYWQHQISFYNGIVTDQKQWETVVPVVIVATFAGQLRVVAPNVTEDYREILFNLNLAWNDDALPPYMEVRTADCKKCPLQRCCTEPITTISEFAQYVLDQAVEESE